MSALARYFMHYGKVVAGYDQTETPLTRQLETEGASIHYLDDPTLIPSQFQHFDERTLIIYTPALPQNAEEIAYFRSLGYRLYKRAEVLGVLARSYRVFAVSGAHGKTTTTTLLMYLLSQSQGCDAFMGGISLNVNSNLYLGDKGQHNLVVEADEYDRSFLQLNPYVTIVTSIISTSMALSITLCRLSDSLQSKMYDSRLSYSSLRKSIFLIRGSKLPRMATPMIAITGLRIL